MSFQRLMVQEGTLQRAARSGDHMSQPVVSIQNTDSAQTLGVPALAAGCYVRGGMTAGRTDTTATAAQILAAPGFANMDIGDAYRFTISVVVAFTLTIAGGTGVTVVGQSTVAANTARDFLLIRTGAATFDLRGL